MTKPELLKLIEELERRIVALEHIVAVIEARLPPAADPRVYVSITPPSTTTASQIGAAIGAQLQRAMQRQC